MKKRLFVITFILSSLFVINDMCNASAQMQQFTLDLSAMQGVYTSSYVGKNEFSNQKYWNNATFNSSNGNPYNLLVELRDTEAHTSNYKTISNGSTYTFDDTWQTYAAMTYYVKLKSGTWTFNQTYTTGIWYISY